jgi:hypothetical protein
VSTLSEHDWEARFWRNYAPELARALMEPGVDEHAVALEWKRDGERLIAARRKQMAQDARGDRIAELTFRAVMWSALRWERALRMLHRLVSR